MITRRLLTEKRYLVLLILVLLLIYIHALTVQNHSDVTLGDAWNEQIYYGSNTDCKKDRPC